MKSKGAKKGRRSSQENALMNNTLTYMFFGVIVRVHSISFCSFNIFLLTQYLPKGGDQIKYIFGNHFITLSNSVLFQIWFISKWKNYLMDSINGMKVILTKIYYILCHELMQIINVNAYQRKIINIKVIGIT